MLRTISRGEVIEDPLFDLKHLPAINIRLSRMDLVPTRSFCVGLVQLTAREQSPHPWRP